ncbi:hypothetical protein GEV33_015584 [Tenebrio molitor]|uniref:Uncharacterized protein n=1 Tax=Tenebrio molitor TaxID=7067 RepID=A0A8J6H3G2_TENMO|nr:hypothetical protein GEV33_015585 [Tenebrio molitor]KAH0807207.1 hypothetical protein GEV33_015584 [Tenebrio molitor]
MNRSQTNDRISIPQDLSSNSQEDSIVQVHESSYPLFTGRRIYECSRIHRDGNVLGLPPKNLRTEGVEAINRGNQRQNGDFSRPFAGSVVRPTRRRDVVEFTRAVGDDSSKYHRPHRQADHGLHYGRFQTERFCGSGSRRVLSVQVVPGLTGRCRIYPPASQEQW